MKAQQAILFALSLISTGAHATSDWAAQIQAVVPSSVTVAEIEELPDHLTLTGDAPSNTDIASLMRAIDVAKLGAPELQQIRRAGELSRFIVRIKRTR